MLTQVDPTRVEEFAGRLTVDAGAALTTALITIGDRLGLFRAMADGQPVTAAELAARTGTFERYVREWLNHQAAAEIVAYGPEADAYVLPAEHALLLADDDSPFAMAGVFQAASAAFASRDRVAERFRTGEGLGWHEHHHDLFCGTERAFGASYRAHLVSEWLPALDGVVAKLEAGALVADVGCGHGASTILMAQAFPKSQFIGCDVHAEAIEIARQRAWDGGVADSVRFDVADATTYGREGFDLIACFDALHDMGDPIAAARHARSAIAPDGTWIIVEPNAGDRIEDNLNPIGRLYYGMSTLLCTPGSLSQPGRAALGTQAGEARLREVILSGGFTTVRRATETPLNMVLEAQP